MHYDAPELNITALMRAGRIYEKLWKLLKRLINEHYKMGFIIELHQKLHW